MILVQKMLQKVKQTWKALDGYKTLIGLSLDFINVHILSQGTWYGDLCGILAYVFIFIGGTHKLTKSEYGQRTINKIQRKISSIH